MKTKLLALLLFGTLSINAQVLQKYKNDIIFSAIDLEGECYLLEGVDGELAIKGDSLSVIKLLLKELKEQVKSNEEAGKCISKSVDWSNTVPDYWKKNKKWLLYILEIKKQGYKLNIKNK